MTTALKRPAAPAAVLPAEVFAELLGYGALGRSATREARAPLARASATYGRPDVVGEHMLEGLPAPVRRYLRYTGVVGRPLAGPVGLKHRGKMSGARPWTPPTGKTLYPVRSPGSDEEMDQSTVMRYLSELIWFPSALLADNVSLTAADDDSARITLTQGGRTASGTLFFDLQGRLTDFVAERQLIIGGRSQLETWSTVITGYDEFDGLRLPARGKTVRKIPAGHLEYIEVIIIELDLTALTATAGAA